MNEADEFLSSTGGPLSVQRESGQWVLAGTVSHGIKCAVPNQPGVYMRTTWYQPWIEKVTRAFRGRNSPVCHGPPGSCDHRGRSGGILNTIFRVFRIARKMWKSRK
jgi:secreted trypsin-like serine protease